jgi:hypothetical protein
MCVSAPSPRGRGSSSGGGGRRRRCFGHIAQTKQWLVRTGAQEVANDNGFCLWNLGINPAWLMRSGLRVGRSVRGIFCVRFRESVVGMVGERVCALCMEVWARRLREAILGVPDIRDPDDVVTGLGLADLFSALVTRAVDGLDRSGLTAADGAVNTRAWLRWRGRRSERAAGELMRRVRRLRGLPAVAEAWPSGVLADAPVEAMVAHVNDRTEAVLAARQSEIVAPLAPLSGRDAAMVMARWAAAPRRSSTPSRPRWSPFGRCSSPPGERGVGRCRAIWTWPGSRRCRRRSPR